jgi:uncharacterized ferritin-like protein (DUF455 family)
MRVPDLAPIDERVPDPAARSAATTPSGSIEQWAERYVLQEDLSAKLDPVPIPRDFDTQPRTPLDVRPGRGRGFLVREHGDRSTGKSALKSAERRARLIHSFMHHELQAAELMAWALLRFPDAPGELRRGLVRVMADELRHLGMYASYLRERGFEPGCFPVRDWFWERIPTVPTIAAFLATLGVGFEGANLDHATRFAARFRAAGDPEGARLQERVALEEVPHVRFALRWFRQLEPEASRGGTLFDAWASHLPAPLSPMVMRGRPMDRALRRRAGLDDAFLDALESYEGPANDTLESAAPIEREPSKCAPSC